MSLITRLADRRADELAAAVGELQELQSELAYRATHDPLTGLANRSVLDEELAALTGRRLRRRSLALILLDLDNFKSINDSFGHPVGDELLVDVSDRLTAVSPPDSTVVRLGGDEFAILVVGCSRQAGLALAEKVRDRLNQPYQTSQGRLSASTSVGVRAGSQRNESPSELLRDADLALYAAKAAGKNHVSAFDPRLRKA